MKQFAALWLICLMTSMASASITGPWGMGTLLHVPRCEKTDRAARPGKTGLLYDAAYFGHVTVPTFWVNGTNDTHFPMPSTQRSAQAVQGPAIVRFELKMPHGHGAGWRPREIYVFADSIVKDS